MLLLLIRRNILSGTGSRTLKSKNSSNHSVVARFNHALAAEKIEQASRILVMTGAGLSTPSGIPDFRTPGSGIYDNLQKYTDLPYPEAIFDIRYFEQNPKPFYTWAKEFFPGVHYKPNDGHYFISALEKHSKLLRLFTQNIDGLELLVNLPEDKLVFAHGGFASASCITCKAEYNIEDVKNSILNRKIPYCEKPIDNENPFNFNIFSSKIPKSYTEIPDGPDKLFCGGLVKPDIVFFGENLPRRFFELQEQDTDHCDLLICIGTSLEVYPFAGLADLVAMDVPRILINREKAGSFGMRKNDIILKGELELIVHMITEKLNWKLDTN